MKFTLVPIVFILLPSVVSAQNLSNAGEALKHYVADLQKSPDDQALREKIIKLALVMNPKPVVPDDALMREGAAERAFHDAKASSDYSDAAKEYEKALLVAPWVAADYYNCGVAHEKAGENKEATHAFNLYLLATPNANDAADVKKHIGGLQYAQQKIDEQERQQAQAAQAQRDSEARAAQAERDAEAQAAQARLAQQEHENEFNKKLEGDWRLTGGNCYTKTRASWSHMNIRVHEGQLQETFTYDRDDPYGHHRGNVVQRNYPLQGYVATAEFGSRIEISTDFQSITRIDNNGDTWMSTRQK
jgi:hypothetical protein